MGLGWDSVLKLGAFGACLMVTILVISFFVGISHDSFWFSIQLIVAVILFVIILVSWRALKKVITNE
jgi:hypothetical protein